MWSAFSWENKIMVSTNATSLSKLILGIAEITHMKIVSDCNKDSDSDFMAANLYVSDGAECEAEARSLFGEDVLLNISVEQTPMGISGYYRIRSKTQGVAISLGNVIKMKQRDM